MSDISFFVYPYLQHLIMETAIGKKNPMFTMKSGEKCNGF